MATEEQALTFETRDEFQRKGAAEKAINLLLSDVDVSPMVVDGKWGTGKTEFCRKLINLLLETHPDVHCAYVDAFKADHADSPLVTLIAAVANLIDDQEERANFIQKAVPAVRYGLKALGKAGVAWLLKQNADDIADELEATVKQVGEDSVNASIERLIKDHQHATENLDALRDALIKVSEINPLIIFIDELDRCRPDFAVSILEHIKHVFDVPNVQFVLVANLDQLRSSINHCYGLGVDAQRYLDKFLKFSFRLSSHHSHDQYNYSAVSEMHAENLIRNHATLAGTALVNEGFLRLIRRLIVVNELSLREVETFVRHIEIYNVLCDDKAFAENRNFGYGVLQIMGVFYFCFRPEICDELEHGVIDGPRMAEVLGISTYTRSSDRDGRDLILAIATLIFLESTIPVEGLDLGDEEDIAAWNEEIHPLFQSAGFPPSRGERVSKITQPIRTLRLTR